MKLLVCMLPKRLEQYPSVHTLAEDEFGDAYSIWFWAFAPAKIPHDVVKRLSDK